MKQSEIVEIYTDGACKGNPGIGGWGVVLKLGATEKELFGGERNTTNNRMELLAAINGLRALKRSCHVILTTDSKYVKNGIEQWITKWKLSGWKTANKKDVKNKDLWVQLDELVKEHSVQWAWVKGHAGHSYNERADQLANRGVEKARSC